MPYSENKVNVSEGKYSFSDPLLQVNFASPEQKSDKEFGRRLISRIYKEQSNNNSTMFYMGRLARWQENWVWAMGRQPIQEFLDYTSVSDANKAYTNIDITPDRTGPQFTETLVNSMAQNEEYPSVTAIDDYSLQEKEDRKQEALYRMRNVQTIGQMQEMSGLQLEDPNAYVPDDELSAEVYFKLEDRLPKEIELEQYLEKVMHDNEYDILKRRIIRDLVVVNCSATKIERMSNGFVGIRKCTSNNLLYNFFLSDSGKMELSYIGEVYSLKVRDLRKKYSKSEANPKGLSEKEIFELASTSNQGNVANRWNYYWREDYMWLIDRPYDDYNITVFDCEVQCVDTDYYVSKTDNYGKENIKPKNGIPKPTSDKATVIQQPKTRWYKGVWAISADRMIYWGLPDVVITPFMDIATSLSSYTINIPNNDGEYVPSLFERAIEPLRRKQVALLKLKQLIGAMAPAGITLDVETIRDIDLGNGNTIPWTEVLKIRNQTGVVLWSSAGLNPNERNNRPPIEGIANAESVAQLNELMVIIEKADQQIRSLLGVPFYRDGSDVGERTAAKLAEGQTVSSFNVTDFIKTGFIQLIQETLYKCSLLKWDELVIKKGRSELNSTIFRVAIEMKISVYEKQQLERMIEVGMANQLLNFVDAFRIRQIKNFKLATWYLAQTTEKNKRQEHQNSIELQKANAEVQQQSNQQQAENAERIEAQKYQAQLDLKKVEIEGQMKNNLLQSILKMQEISMQQNVPVPSELKPLMSAVFSNIAIPLVKENKDMQREIVAEAMQQQLMMQQATIPQEEREMPPSEIPPQEMA